MTASTDTTSSHYMATSLGNDWNGYLDRMIANRDYFFNSMDWEATPSASGAAKKQSNDMITVVRIKESGHGNHIASVRKNPRDLTQDIKMVLLGEETGMDVEGVTLESVLLDLPYRKGVVSKNLAGHWRLWYLDWHGSGMEPELNGYCTSIMTGHLPRVKGAMVLMKQSVKTGRFVNVNALNSRRMLYVLEHSRPI